MDLEFVRVNDQKWSLIFAKQSKPTYLPSSEHSTSDNRMSNIIGFWAIPILLVSHIKIPMNSKGLKQNLSRIWGWGEHIFYRFYRFTDSVDSWLKFSGKSIRGKGRIESSTFILLNLRSNYLEVKRWLLCLAFLSFLCVAGGQK